MSAAAYDAIVIGGGPGGYVAAIRASQLGLKTALVERADLGGICLNWGCIPTKTLLHASGMLARLESAGEFGIDIQGMRIDLPRIVGRSRDVADRLRAGVAHLLRKNDVTVHQGHARLDGPGRVIVTPASGNAQPLAAPSVLIATGASPRPLDGMPVDGDRVWNYRHALTPSDIPASLLIVGAGAIGMEFASFYAALGTRVTLVETQDRVLPAEDEDVSQWVARAYAERGIAIRTGTSATLRAAGPDSAKVVLRQDERTEEHDFERVLVCAGVVGNIDGLGLETTRVAVDRDTIRVDRGFQTGEPGIYAIGDVCGPPMLAHKASHEGLAWAQQLAGQPVVHTQAAIPACTYCDPQVASIGLTERQARDRGMAVSVGRFPFHGNGKALAIGEPAGFVKTIFDTGTGELLGAHLVGPDVTELIHGLSIARQMEATEEDFMLHIYAHPTLSEAIGESVMAAYGRAIHI